MVSELYQILTSKISKETPACMLSYARMTEVAKCSHKPSNSKLTKKKLNIYPDAIKEI